MMKCSLNYGNELNAFIYIIHKHVGCHFLYMLQSTYFLDAEGVLVFCFFWLITHSPWYHHHGGDEFFNHFHAIICSDFSNVSKRYDCVSRFPIMSIIQKCLKYIIKKAYNNNWYKRAISTHSANWVGVAVGEKCRMEMNGDIYRSPLCVALRKGLLYLILAVLCLW